jgi:hypothetical protein
MMIQKLSKNSHEMRPLRRWDRMEEVEKKAGDLAHHPARNSAG